MLKCEMTAEIVCLAGEGSRKFLRTFSGWIFAQIWIMSCARWCNLHVRKPDSGAACFISASDQTGRMRKRWRWRLS